MAGKGGLYNPRPVDNIPVNGQVTHGVTSNWAYDHAADLDAHTYNILQKVRTGDNYYQPYAAERWTTIALVANHLYASPLLVARDMTVDRIAFEVSTQDAGSNARVGIYNDGTNLYPGTLLVDAGAIATATTGVKIITIDQALTKGLYWVAIVSDGVPQIKMGYSTQSPLGQPISDLGGNMRAHWKVAFAYGALPTPFTAAGGMHSGWFHIMVRPSSLD